MQIDLDLLFTWGAIAKKYKKNDMIFDENDTAHYYYQIIEGSVRLFNSNEDGKEFTQDLLLTGDSFGDSSLLIDKGYPSKAVSLKESTIIKLTKENFFNLLEEYPYLQKQFMISMAQKM